MLNGICSNKNIEKILLFLYVNESGYGSQVQNLLDIPLTPLQNALNRLEEGLVITHKFKGNKKIYSFNKNYSLHHEFMQLLKKLYTLLPPEQKKRYCFIHKPRATFIKDLSIEKQRKTQMELFWKRLQKVKKLIIDATIRDSDQIEHKVGQSQVSIKKISKDKIIFEEHGFWFKEKSAQQAFHNSYQWTLDHKMDLITLEHLRYGEKRAVFLFHLTSNYPKTLESVDSHLCGEDTYLGNIIFSSKSIDFSWRIIGPSKNHTLNYQYF